MVQHAAKCASDQEEIQNLQICTKMEFMGYEISIAMDQSLGASNDLKRTEILLFRDGEDVTTTFLDKYNEEFELFLTPMRVFTDSNDLFWIMKTIVMSTMAPRQ
jgi:hypothetical protein